MTKICCVEDANVCPKSSSCSMVLRSACSHEHSRESSTVKNYLNSSSPSRSKHSSAATIVKRESHANGSLHFVSLASSLKQLALKSTEKSYSLLAGGFCNSFEISEKACQNTEASSLNVSCAVKELNFSQLTTSHDSSVYKNINNKECNKEYSNATESDINSSEHLISNMSRRLTRSSTPLVRPLSANEDDDDISIHSIVRPRFTGSSNNSNYSSSRLQRGEVTHQYLSTNNVDHFERHGDTNNHFMRHSGNSDGDGSNSFTESAFIDRSTVVQNSSIFHRLHWSLWSFIYMMIINVVNFDVWLLSRINSFGKNKVMLWCLLPLILYMIVISGLQSDSLIEDKSQKYSSYLSPVYNLLSSIFSIFGYFSKENEDLDLYADTAVGGSEVTGTFFHGISGLFGTLSGWLIGTGEKASLLVQKNNPEPAYDQNKEEIKSMRRNEENSQSSKEEIKMLALEVFMEEVDSLKGFLKSNLQGDVFDKLEEREKTVVTEIKSLHLELKSLAVKVERLEKELMKQNEKDEIKANIAAITENDVGQLKMKLKSIETKMNVLKQQSLKSCCDKQWNTTDFLAMLEKHLILAFRKVVDADSDATSKYRFFSEWLGSKFYNREKLMQVINAALIEQKSYSDNEMDYDYVIKVVESSVLKHVESVKRNLSESTPFFKDFFSEDKVKKIVKEAIMLYDADKIGQVDYALESGGGSVLGTRCSETYIEKYGKLSIFGLPLWTDSNSPRTAIQPDVQPGRCWAFKGSQGFLVIELSATIYPTGFTLEHIPVSLSPSGSIDSAPKNFSVWGLDNEKDNRGILLGEYTYEVNGEPLQYFPIKKHSEKAYTYVELQIHSNHGNMEYTCLYRFRVHGKRLPM